MENTLIAIKSSGTISVATDGLLKVPIAAGTISRFHVELQSGTNATGGDAIFNVAKNDVKLYSGGTRLTMTSGTNAVSKTGLSEAVNEGDILRLDLESLGDPLTLPVGFFITFDDGRTLGYYIDAASAETTIADGDLFGFADVSASNVLKKITWANVKATAKTYFDTLYQPVSAVLSAFAALSPSNDDFLQRKAGAWANRTIAQVKTDLGLSGTNSGDQDLSGYAPLASPTFTGTPAAPTATTGTNTTQVATTAFVQQEMSAAGSFTTEDAQDAVGAMVDSSLNYVDGTPLLQRAALTGDVTAAAGSNSTTIANDAVTYAKMQNVSAASKLIGRGDSGSGDPEEITLGTGLTMSGTTLNASASGGASASNILAIQQGNFLM